MTADAIQMLSDKIAEVKEDLAEDVKGLKSDMVRDVGILSGKLDGIHQWMLTRPAACPKAGLCVVLEQRIEDNCAHYDRRLDDDRDDIVKCQLAIAKIQKWQAKAVGALFVLLTALSIFGPSIRAAFKLP